MQRANVGRAILGGFVATLAMTILMYAAPMLGMPEMDIAGMLGSLFVAGMPPQGSAPWWIGMFIHFINGTLIFPLIFAYLLYGRLPGRPWLRGVIWGVTLWFLAQVIVMPVMGMGLFSSATPQPALSVIGSLIGHLIYGAILGGITGTAGAEVTRRDQYRRAA